MHSHLRPHIDAYYCIGANPSCSAGFPAQKNCFVQFFVGGLIAHNLLDAFLKCWKCNFLALITSWKPPATSRQQPWLFGKSDFPAQKTRTIDTYITERIRQTVKWVYHRISAYVMVQYVKP